MSGSAPKTATSTGATTAAAGATASTEEFNSVPSQF